MCSLGFEAQYFLQEDVYNSYLVVLGSLGTFLEPKKGDQIMADNSCKI